MFDKKVFVRISSKLKDKEDNFLFYDSKLISIDDAKECFLRFEDSVYKGTTFYLELINNISICIPVSEVFNLMIYPEEILENE
jgi:hypothetical protein